MLQQPEHVLPRRAAIVLLPWLALLALALWVAARSNYVADLSAFLPSTPTAEQAVLLDQVRSGAATRMVLIGIEGGSAENRADASRRLAAALREQGLFDAVHNGDDTAWRQAGDFVFANRYLLSPAVTPQRFTADGLRAAMADTLALLGTPAAGLVKATLFRDPTGEAVQIAQALVPADGPRKDQGVWVSRQAPRAVLIATTRAPGNDLDGQALALADIQQRFAALPTPGLTLRVTGPGSFGVSSRARIQSEVERLAIAGGLLVIGLLLLAFGSPRALGTALLPVASGVVAGIAAVSLGFGKVHGITLGFGATLIGESVDYGIYYLIQSRSAAGAAGGAGHWIQHSWPTVRLGLWTSLCGFAALLFSGFPGLAQLGLFTMAGLAAAALTTRYVLPLLAPDGASGRGLRGPLGRWSGMVLLGLARRVRPAWVAGLALLALASLLALPSPWRGNLNSLSPISAAEMRLDSELRADLGSTEGSSLLALTAPDEAAVLRLAEQVSAQLDTLVTKGELLAYNAPSRLLPSPQTQQRRRAALPDAATLSAALAQATADGPLRAERLEPFIQEVQAAKELPLLDHAALAASPLASSLSPLLQPPAPGQPWRALITLQAGPQGVPAAAVKQALAGLSGAHLVEIGPELAQLYARYLHEALWQAALGGLAVCLLLAVHLRSARRLLRVLQPIAVSVLVVLAALSASGVALGILHLVGLLLMVAIGSNYALFIDHLRHAGQADPDTLASLTLANLTTVLSFGLLAWSEIPALHAIGLVVAPGALLSLLLAAALMGADASSPAPPTR
jgi:predicted exporter